MAFWSRWFKKANSANPDPFSGLLYPYRGQPPRRGTRELIAAYREQPWLRAVTQKIAQNVAHTPWRLYTQKAPGQRAQKHAGLIYGDRKVRERSRKSLAVDGALTEITDHPLLDLLNVANPSMTGRGALQLTQTYLDLKGESFWLLQRNAEGMPVGFFPLPPHWIVDVPNAIVRTFRVNAYSNSTRAYFEVPETEVLWLKDIDPENPYGRGTGVAESLGDELDTDENASKFLKSWFQNNAMPGVLVSLENASADELKRAKEMWMNDFRGGGNYNAPKFANGKMNAVRLDSSFREQQLVELRQALRDVVMHTYGVPPEVMGVLENSNRATIDASFYLFAQCVLMPRLEFLRTELQARLIPQFDDRLCLEYESPVPEDAEFSLKVATAAPWAFSKNEWRAFADHEPLPDGDDVFPPLAQPGQKPDGQAGDGKDSPDDSAGADDDSADPSADQSGAKQGAKLFSAFRR